MKYIHDKLMGLNLNITDVMASALVKNSFSSSELKAIKDIEDLRSSLLLSSEVISFNSPDNLKRKLTRPIKYITDKAVTSKENAILMFNIIRALKPNLCLDMGTGLGFAASYMAAAIDLNGFGKVVTMEAIPEIARYAENNFIKLGYDIEQVVGLFYDTLDSLLNNSGKIGFIFLGGHLEKKPRIDYFNTIVPFLSEQAVVVCNGVNRKKGNMDDAWLEIIKEPLVKISFTIGPMGYCIFDNKTKKKVYL